MADTTGILAFERGRPLNFPDNEMAPLSLSTNSNVVPKAGYTKLNYKGRNIFVSFVSMSGANGSYFSTIPIKCFLIYTPKYINSPLLFVMVNFMYMSSVKTYKNYVIVDFGLSATNTLQCGNSAKWFTLNSSYKKLGNGPFALYDNIDNVFFKFEELSNNSFLTTYLQDAGGSFNQFGGHFVWACPISVP